MNEVTYFLVGLAPWVVTILYVARLQEQSRQERNDLLNRLLEARNEGWMPAPERVEPAKPAEEPSIFRPLPPKLEAAVTEWESPSVQMGLRAIFWAKLDSGYGADNVLTAYQMGEFNHDPSFEADMRAEVEG